MKRFSIALSILLIASACGGATSEGPSEQGELAALEDTKDNTSTTSRDKAGDGKKNDSGEVMKSGPTSTGATKTNASAADSNGDSKVASAAGGPQNAAPIPAGSYEYTTDGQTSVSGSSRDLPDITTLTAESPRGGEQQQVRDLRDKDGNGTVTETHLLYESDGVYLTYVKVTSSFPGGFTDVREFDIPKPQLIAPAGAGPGFKRSFSIQGSGTRADFTIKALRFESISIDGSAVDALIVDTKIVFSGSLEGEQNSLSWFWPKYVVMLKEQVHTDVTNGPIRVKSDYEAIARQLPR